ncbi:flagellar hook-associated protein FlgL [Thiobacter aerophilum]|uniref:Flagellar hook-associated protein FlgL n=1 Tax=Thiobacter aerophilum TaxID=3121275 RepID=A0ABV0EFZ7_9BURK
MRISSPMIYELGVSAIQNRTSELVKFQQQLAAGRRLLAPSDDPVASAQTLEIAQSLSVTQQYQANITRAHQALSLEDTVLGQIARVIQDAKVTAINSGNPTLSPANLRALAAELKGRYQELLGLANSQDGQGQYLFAGYQSQVRPFTQTSGAGVYAGDQGIRSVQIAASRRIAINDTGQDVFRPGVAGQDVFATLDTLINQLDTGSITGAQLSAALSSLDNALNNVLRVRASVGARLRELDATDGTHGDSVLQYQTTLSELTDLDYAKAITDLTRTQTALEAAQKSFVSISQLSLFNYIGR